MTQSQTARLVDDRMAAKRLPDPDPWNSVAVRLAREFDAPIGLLDPRERLWRVRVGVRAEEFPDPDATTLAALGQTRAGLSALWRPGGDHGPTWLLLPLDLPELERVIAVAGFQTAARNDASGQWGPPCPEPALVAWGNSVSERLHVESGSQLAPGRSPVPGPWGNHLVGYLLRRLRVSDPPERYQRLAVCYLREEIDAACLAWVPGNPRESVVVEGQVEGMGPEVFRTLIPEPPHETVRMLCESTPAGPRRIVVVAADRETPSGWLVAVAGSIERQFLPSEIEQLRSVAPLLAAQRSNARLYADLKDLLFGIIRALSSAIDAKDPYTSGHSERVARIAVRLGEQLGMNANQRGDLYLMGLLHDIGKIGIADSVLKKPGRLSPEEYRQIQSHVKIGVHILTDLKKLHHLLPGVAHHHECYDGTGYPSGLVGEAIPLAARILSVADAYDAMSSSRPYRRRLDLTQIDENFRKGAGTQWDAKVVDALFACREEIERIRSKGVGDSLRMVIVDTLGRG